jgi:hypothetical protein
MPPRALVTCVLLVATATPALAQEAVLLSLGGPTGRPIRSRIVVSTFVRGIPMGMSVADTTLPSTRLTMYYTRTLDGISGDTLSFTVVIDSARAESPASPELNAMLESAVAAARGRTTFRVDARGGFLWADSSDAAGGEGAPAGGAGARRLAGAAGPREGGFVLPMRAVRVGDTWADSSPLLRQMSGPEIRSRRLYRLERIEPRGDSGTAVITMTATLTVQMSTGMMDVPSAGIARFDIAAHRVTAFSITTVFSAPAPGGQITTRSETVLNELGDSALTPPLLRRAIPPAAPAPAPPRPESAAAPDSEPVDTELSPAPARFTVIRLGAPEGQLNTLLAEHVRRARAAGRRAFAEFDADWCGPCRSLKRYLGDRRMVEAFDGTYIIKLNLDRWQGRLAGTGFTVNAIPVFHELGDDGRPTGRQIDGGAWGEDIPENMAPPLRAFFQQRRR